MQVIPDCLVMKIEEFEFDSRSSNDKIDTTIYILYDQKMKHYVIRGKRRDSVNHSSAEYSFDCIEASDLESFLSFVICTKNYWSLSLYNYDNLPYKSINISYDFLQKNESKEYEISGYDKLKYSKKSLIKNLKMLKNVFNNYN